MEYLLDSRVFHYLPFTICPNTRKNIISIVMKIVIAADWLCKIRELQLLVENHPTLVVSEFVYTVLWLLSFFCALRYGSRYVYTWVGVYLLAIFAENIKFADESINVMFYSQTVNNYGNAHSALFIMWYLPYIVLHFIYYIHFNFHSRIGFCYLILRHFNILLLMLKAEFGCIAIQANSFKVMG
uniref:DUF7802 domain-containing protein n=1 Tax=Wuchereria bancrofti TaxID=6293 RepID=A0A1I8EDR3_WUCBA